MKTVRKLFFCALVAAPMLIPMQSKAGGLDDLLNWLFGGGDRGQKHQPPPPPPAPGCGPGTSVPINGGLVILMVAGLGLGAKMLYDAQKGNELETSTI
jgi:hypothetical protein